MKKYKKFKPPNLLTKPVSNLFVFLAGFVIVGALILVITHASAPNTSIEPEDGTSSGNSCSGSASSASSGRYIQFGCNMTVVNVPAKIASDCSADVTDDLNVWLASLPDNTIAMLKKDACYSTEDQIDVLDKTNFSLDGNGSTFRRTMINGNGSNPKSNHIHVRIARSQHIDVKNLIITGIKPDSVGYTVTYEGQHGFGLYGVIGGTFDNVKISSIYGDCFYLNRGQVDGTAHGSENITIKNSYCHQSGRHGVAFLTAHNVLITNNTIENNHRENFDFEPYGVSQSGGADNITIDNNDIGPASQLMVSYGGGGPFYNFTFSNNRLHRPFGMDLEAGNNGPNTNFKIINNKVVDPDKINHGGAIQVHGVTGITISGNSAMFDSVNAQGIPNSYFAQFFYAHQIVISNNSMVGARTELNYDLHTDTYCGSGNTPEFTNLPACN